jgi:hypothetical protein
MLAETFGTAVWLRRRVVSWRGTRIAIVPLEVQIATMLVRDQQERLRAVQDAVDPEVDLDRDLLRDAIAARESEAGETIQRQAWIDELLS